MSGLTAPPEIDLITDEDLFAMDDIGPSELIDGRIVTKSPAGDEHGTIALNLVGELRAFVRQHKLGRVTGGEVGICIRGKPDTIRATDTACQRHSGCRSQTCGRDHVALRSLAGHSQQAGRLLLHRCRAGVDRGTEPV